MILGSLESSQRDEHFGKLNSKSITIIAELRKENTEIKIENIKLKAKNIKVKAKNEKLKQILEKHGARFTNLKQKDKETTDLIAKLEQSRISDSYPINSNDAFKEINLLYNNIDITNNASNSNEYQKETSS
ncbi:hypothetical protein C2G38_2174180 [Gigaspora rosea]|uniref:Uncharacterized protein n=1 Tax=Gigaspora rosea TaxID=44941 RepID=A0A397VIQ3_9GLOM|nr:hypothetical protein C2G38_2174180 [Gigaspora rosea]